MVTLRPYQQQALDAVLVSIILAEVVNTINKTIEQCGHTVDNPELIKKHVAAELAYLVKLAVPENNHELLPCPFCGEIPDFPSGNGTQYYIECDCGQALASVQITDLMSTEERRNDNFVNYRFNEEYIERAKVEAITQWNTRVMKR